ncbi:MULTISPECIES: hypothetical protein [Sphingobium]|uniref:hypothetical protein n=1 Tax=Sphingobium TaxID=165695 RepID=UPI001604382A|nr:hypothetical protein [Sphingobium terrigena]
MIFRQNHSVGKIAIAPPYGAKMRRHKQGIAAYLPQHSPDNGSSDIETADKQTSFARFRRDVRALFSLLSLLIKFTGDLTAKEARKSQDGGIRFGRKTGRCISIGPFFLHCGRAQDLEYAQLLEP